jgi:hypothetical protein
MNMKMAKFYRVRETSTGTSYAHLSDYPGVYPFKINSADSPDHFEDTDLSACDKV